jgi:hypothetical protein
MAERPVKHRDIRWNPATQERFCLVCGRTSDHASQPDARVELEQYDCHIPWVEMPAASLDNSGNQWGGD